MSAQVSQTDPAIYMVEADPTVRRRADAALAGLPWPIHHFESPRELLDSLSYDAHGCVVANVALVEMTVQELLQELGREQHKLAIILLSNNIGVAEAVAAMRAGVHDVLPLPVVERALRRQVRLAMSDLRTNLKASR